MRRDAVANGRTTMARWYTEHAEPWLAARVDRYARRARVEPDAVAVQETRLPLGFAACLDDRRPAGATVVVAFAPE
jgi:hypothetical protein